MEGRCEAPVAQAVHQHLVRVAGLVGVELVQQAVPRVLPRLYRLDVRQQPAAAVQSKNESELTA